MVKQMITAFYTSNYDDATGEDDKMDFNARMYATADKFQIPFLKELAKSKLNGRLNFCAIGPELFQVIRTIYTTTPNTDRGLRDLLSPVLKRFRHHLKNHVGFMQLLESDGGFAADAFAALAQLLDPQPAPSHWCLECDAVALARSIFCKECGDKIGQCW